MTTEAQSTAVSKESAAVRVSGLLSERYWFLAEARVAELQGRICAVLAGRVQIEHEARIVVTDDRAQVEKPYTIEGNIAIVPVIGVLTKYPDWYDDYCGLCATEGLQAKLECAANDPDVEKIILWIDCPGGAVNGTVEAAQAIARINKTKPIYAFISGMCASGGYYLASQCTQIIAAPSSEVGCIGVYCVLMDYSKFLEDNGLSMTVVRSGKYKGLGADGKVSDDLIEDQQRIVNGLHLQFVADVARGRNIDVTKASDVADGRVWLPADAQRLGLIDQIASRDAAFQILTGSIEGQEINMAKAISVPRGQDANAADTNKPAAENTAGTKKNDDGGDDTDVDTTSADYKSGYDAGYKNGYDSGYSACQKEMEDDEDGDPEDDKGASAGKRRKVATAGELKAAFPNHTGFVIDQLEAQSSITKAKAAFADVLAKENEGLRAANLKLENQIKGITGGVEPVGMNPETHGSETATAVEGPTDAAKVEADAKKNWAANKDHCRERFVSEAVFINVAKREAGVK